MTRKRGRGRASCRSPADRFSWHRCGRAVARIDVGEDEELWTERCCRLLRDHFYISNRISLSPPPTRRHVYDYTHTPSSNKTLAEKASYVISNRYRSERSKLFAETDYAVDTVFGGRKELHFRLLCARLGTPWGDRVFDMAVVKSLAQPGMSIRRVAGEIVMCFRQNLTRQVGLGEQRN
ncbi:hypothetical protein KC334_g44 [Hortaea werneckii]|nr:hypothetical protein KC334_g44 [Hortaea werneckii]KAI7028368.1 hypothetical protein KC355_g46 [Hortaea werneckii]